MKVDDKPAVANETEGLMDSQDQDAPGVTRRFKLERNDQVSEYNADDGMAAADNISSCFHDNVSPDDKEPA